MTPALVDTSCLIALGRIRRLELLTELYEVVAITEEVRAEYSQKYADSLPDWIIIVSPKDLLQQKKLEDSLDPGEASLIQLARELPESLLILDELKARNIAKQEGLQVTGTIGILIEAKELKLIEALLPCFEELRKTDFRFSGALEREALVHSGELPAP